jgi:D-3-phosphoglycerate dehydrogenase
MKVAFLDTVHGVLAEGLLNLGYDCTDLTLMSKEAIISLIPEFEGIVVRSRFPIDSNFLQHCTSLKFIARSGAGMENIDQDFCAAHNIQLFNAPEGNRNAVAEHALGMLLSLFNKLNLADAEVRAGIWDRDGNRGVELDGKKVGLIGFGNNGTAFAKKLSGFNVEIKAFDRYKFGFGTSEVQEVELKDLQDCDVISLHIPQNEETMWMIDTEFIAVMQKPFYLINLSRGKIVSTKSLLDGLKSGKLLGACLDVLEYEKASFEDMFKGDLNPDFKELVASEKVILSPHVGGWTQESYFKLSKVLLDKVKRHFHS